MKLTKEMKNVSREWLGTLANLTEFGKAIPTVPYNWEQGMCFGISEACRLLAQVETTEAWKAQIMAAISRRHVILKDDVVNDQKVINKAWLMGLLAVMNYAECLELSGGMDC